MERIALRPARYDRQQISLRKLLILKDEPRSVSADVASALGLKAGDAIVMRACVVDEHEKGGPAFDLYAEGREADWLVRNHENLVDEFPRLRARGKVVCGVTHDVMFAGEDDFVKTSQLHWGILLVTCPQPATERAGHFTAMDSGIGHEDFTDGDPDACGEGTFGWGKLQLPSGIIRWTADRDDEELDADEFV